jgi:hypothetical protein
MRWGVMHGKGMGRDSTRRNIGPFGCADKPAENYFVREKHCSA